MRRQVLPVYQMRDGIFHDRANHSPVSCRSVFVFFIIDPVAIFHDPQRFLFLPILLSPLVSFCRAYDSA